MSDTIREQSEKQISVMEEPITNTNDLTEGVIWKKILTFFFPVVLGTLCEQLYNAVDAVIVGNFVGSNALAAVGGSAAQIISLLIGFFVGLSSGATVVISQYYGARDRKKLEDTVHTAIAFCLVAGAALTLVGMLITPWALRITNNPEDIMEDSIRYLRIYFTGTIPLLLFNMGAGILRAVGDSRRPLYYMIFCCFLNIILDIVFVAVLKWGVAGAAWATVIALTFSAVLIMINLCGSTDIYRVTLGRIRLKAEPLGRMMYIGVPTGLESAMYSISNLVIQAVVNGFGSTVVAACTASGKWDAVYWAVNNSFGVTITAFAGQAFGAGKYDRMKKTMKVCLAMCAGTGAILSVLLLVFGRAGIRLFTDNEQVVEYAIRMMWCWVPFYIVFSFIEVLSGMLRGAGDSIRPAIFVLVGTCLLRIVWCIVVPRRFGTIESVCIAYPVTWVITAIVFVIYYKKGNWLEYCIRKAGTGKQQGTV